jgi:hypothetical protein
VNVHDTSAQIGTMSFYDLLGSERDGALGTLFYAILLTQESWVYRRVETFTVAQDRRFRRQMSIDFRIPIWAMQAAASLQLRNLPVPLLLLEKKALVAFDLRDAAGSSLSVLGRSQNGALARSALESAFRRQQDLPEIHDLSEKIRSIVMDASPSSSGLIDELPQQGGDPNLPMERLKWALATLDTNFVLTADLPIDSLRYRTIVKVGYEEEVSPDSGLSSAGAATSWKAKTRARFGLADAALVFITPEISSCESYHFEIRTPTGIDCSSVALTLDNAEPDKEIVSVERGRTSGSIGHLLASLGTGKRMTGPGPLNFKVTCSLRPSLDGFVLASYISGLLATLLLGVATSFVGRFTDRSPDPAITLLLVLPGVFAALLVRPGEHVLASRLLRFVRGLTLIPGIALFTAAAALAGRPSSSVLFWMWSICFAAAGAATILIGRICDRAVRKPDEP